MTLALGVALAQTTPEEDGVSLRLALGLFVQECVRDPTPTPIRIANASGLTRYDRAIGASGDIAPEDGQMATFNPAQPVTKSLTR